MKERSIAITREMQVSISGTTDHSDLDQPIWAINWFDLKRPKLYTFYNVLAFPHVKKVKAQVHFKGYVRKVIEGNPLLDRKMLLIVKYPDAQSFLSLVSNKVFLLKSVLRLQSVKRFSFGFMQRFGDSPLPLAKPQKYKGTKTYLALVLQGNSDNSTLENLKNLANEHKAELHFLGVKTATIARKKQGVTQTQPFVMDTLAVFEIEKSDILVAALAEIKVESKGIHLLRRIL